MSPEVSRFLGDDPKAVSIAAAVLALVEGFGPVTEKVTTSQIGFWHTRPFAALWRPAQYLSGPCPPLVLTVFLRQRDPWGGWKSVVDPAPGRFTHHAELWSNALDPAICNALHNAWQQAG